MIRTFSVLFFVPLFLTAYDYSSFQDKWGNPAIWVPHEDQIQISDGALTLTTCSDQERKQWFEAKRDLLQPYINKHFSKPGFLSKDIYVGTLQCCNNPRIFCVSVNHRIIGFIIEQHNEYIVITASFPEKYTRARKTDDNFAKEPLHTIIGLCNQLLNPKSSTYRKIENAFPLIFGAMGGGVLYAQLKYPRSPYVSPLSTKWNTAISTCGGFIVATLLYLAIREDRKEQAKLIKELIIEVHR